MWKILHQLASPKWFYQFSGKLLPWSFVLAALAIVYGLYGGLWLSPPDYQQGDAFRIIYVHVPAAALSLSIYVLMAVCAAIFLIWRIKLADVMAQSCAPIGAWITFLTLVTGSIWGKPMWGTWWIWDARLTSELILLFLFLGVIALRSAISDVTTAGRASGLLAIVGVINIPIIRYSVYWWNTLHQKPSITAFAKPTIAPEMLYPLLAMIVGFYLLFVGLLLLRARTEVLKRERRAGWARQSSVVGH